MNQFIIYLSNLLTITSFILAPTVQAADSPVEQSNTQPTETITTGQKVAKNIGKAKVKAQQGVEAAKEKVKKAAAATAEKTKEVKDATAEKMQEAKEAVSDKMTDIKEATNEKIDDIKQTFQDLKEAEKQGEIEQKIQQ